MKRIRYKKNKNTHRNEWLYSQQNRMYDRGKTSIASKIKATQNREEMRRISARVRMALCPFQARGVTKINCNGVEVTTHEEIVEGFKGEAIKRGKETENTPLCNNPCWKNSASKQTMPMHTGFSTAHMCHHLIQTLM